MEVWNGIWMKILVWNGRNCQCGMEMDWKKICQYGIWKNRLPFHSVPCPASYPTYRPLEPLLIFRFLCRHKSAGLHKNKVKFLTEVNIVNLKLYDESSNCELTWSGTQPVMLFKFCRNRICNRFSNQRVRSSQKCKISMQTTSSNRFSKLKSRYARTSGIAPTGHNHSVDWVDTKQINFLNCRK